MPSAGQNPPAEEAETSYSVPCWALSRCSSNLLFARVLSAPPDQPLVTHVLDQRKQAGRNP